MADEGTHAGPPTFRAPVASGNLCTTRVSYGECVSGWPPVVGRGGVHVQPPLSMAVRASPREHMAADVVACVMYWVVPPRRACARTYVEEDPPATSSS